MHDNNTPPSTKKTSSRRARYTGYSGYVIVMKYSLPLIALLLVVTLIVWPQLHVNPNQFSIGFSKIGFSNKENLSMHNARFEGSDLKKQPFAITADIARNLLAGDTKIELEMPKADITGSDGKWLVLTANNGIYDQKKKFLSLAGEVNFFHDSGYEFSTSSAEIYLDKGVAESNENVSGQGPFGYLNAEGFRIEQKGTRIKFKGKSRIRLFLKSKEKAS